MYCLYVWFDYTYIDINALAQGIKSFLASQVWFQAVAWLRTYGTDLPAITSQHANHICMYICMYVCRKEGKKEMFYLTTHSTHFIYGYMASDIW